MKKQHENLTLEREREEGDLNTSDLVFDEFYALWYKTRRPVTPEALIIYSGLNSGAVLNIMREAERAGRVVWRDGGWVPADEG